MARGYSEIVTEEILKKYEQLMAKELAKILNDEHGTTIKPTTIRDYRSKLKVPYNPAPQKEMVIKDKKKIKELTDNDLKEFYEEIAKHQSSVTKMQESVTVGVPDPDKCFVLAFFGDLHFGIWLQDVNTLERDTEAVQSVENVAAVQVGDILDNSDLKSGNHRQYRMVIPREAAINHAVKWFKNIGKKMIAFVTGNHDEWLIKVADIDIGNRIVDEIDGVYLGPCGLITIEFGEELSYQILLSHQSEGYSMWNELHTRARKNRPYLDIVAFGHIHAGAATNDIPIGDFTRGVTVRSAGYWKDVDGYYYDRKVRKFKQESLTPAVVFFPKKRKVEAFADLRDAIVFQQAMNKLIADEID